MEREYDFNIEKDLEAEMILVWSYFDFREEEWV